MTTASPTVSVAVPAYNAELWIASTLESILGQTLPPHEVVVVNDGSTDSTARIVEGFGSAVRLVHQANGGAAAAFNRGFREAAGDYVGKCPADDLWVPEKLEWQLEALAAHPEADILFGAARDFGAIEGDLPVPPSTGILEHSELLRTLYERNVFAAPTALVRRSMHERLGGFREDLVVGEDYDFWLRAVEEGAIVYFDPRLLARLHKHGRNLSMQALMTWEFNLRIHRLHAGVIADRDLVRRTIARDLAAIGRARLGLGCVEEARAAFRDSLRERTTLAGLAGAAALSMPGSNAVFRRLRPPTNAA